MTTRLQEIKCSLQSDDEEIRRSALQALKGVPFTGSLALIFSAMGDESWRVRKESVEAFLSSSPDEPAIDKLLELLRNEDNAGLRNSAAEAVIRLGTEAASPLMRMVKDPDPDVRKFIVDLMGAIGDPLFVQPLLNALQDCDVNVASAAAERLGSLGDSLVVQDLVQAIAANQAVLFRFSALGALSALAKPSVVPEEILSLADHDILRKAVFDCLGSISDDSSIPLLLNGCYSQQKGSRAAAVKAMFKIYGRSGSEVRYKITDDLRSMNGNDVITGLLNLFDSRDSLLTEALIWFSVATGDIRFIPVLLESFVDERFTESILNALKLFGPEGISKVVELYPASIENARNAICTLIGECRYSEYSDLVGRSLKDNSAGVRTAAATAAARLGMISSIPDLVSLTDDTDPNVSSSAVSSLQELASIDRSDILSVARQFGDSEVPRHRRHASLLYASLGENERLLLLAKDEDPTVRKAAVNAIGRLRIKSAGTILVMALVDENPDVRMAAAEALGNINDNSAVEALEHALEDEDTWVRCSVLKAIAKIDRDHTMSIIKRVHPDAEGLFMITCLQILEADCSSDAILIIKSSLANPDPDIARHASMSLERCLSKK
ncbi:MAG: HEAT repeat domain-containing protein [Desulfuromonadaceae bacterium]|nr:HEAT repeat domain-containing protein [Desulfuromonadaceae bacterium]